MERFSDIQDLKNNGFLRKALDNMFRGGVYENNKERRHEIGIQESEDLSMEI